MSANTLHVKATLVHSCRSGTKSKRNPVSIEDDRIIDPRLTLVMIYYLSSYSLLCSALLSCSNMQARWINDCF